MLKSLWRDVRASLNRIFAIVVKEFAVTFGDKGSRMVLIAPVFLQAILFGYGATFNLERVPWVLLDESHSSASAEIVRGITGNGIFDLKRNAVSLADFEKSIDSSEALVGVYFPNDFDRKGEMMVVSDARNSTTAGIAYGYISSIATQVNAKHGGGLAVEVRDRARWNENGITRYTIVPGLIPVLALIQVLLLAGLSVSREREDGSFDMMLMTPADSIEILIGADPHRLRTGLPDLRDRLPLVRASFQGLVPAARPRDLWIQPLHGGPGSWRLGRCGQHPAVDRHDHRDDAPDGDPLGPHDERARHAPLDADRYDPQSASLQHPGHPRRLLRGRGPHGHPAARLARRSRGARLDEPRNLSLQAQDLVICAEDKKLLKRESTGHGRQD